MSERVFKCANVMSAARRCGIGIRETYGPSGYGYVWMDRVTGRVVIGAESPTREEALEQACSALADYFAGK